MTSNNLTLKPVTNKHRSPFAASEPGRWMTEDAIEVVEAPQWHGRSPARRYVAQSTGGGLCAWGATREAAVEGVRASKVA